MQIQKTTEGKQVRITFVPETEQEMRIMGTLRNHYFFGDDRGGTYPEYDGITTKDNFVTSMKFKFNTFE